MIDSRVRKYYEDACDILDSLGIEYGPIKNVTVNTRVKSRWGQCSYNKVDEIFNLDISAILLKGSYEAIMDTVIHELLHAHKDRLNHTGEWKRCAKLINVNYGYNIKRATSAAEKNIEIPTSTETYKYLIKCNNCSTETKYKRRAKIVNLLLKNPNGTCRCGVCGGNSFTVKSC